MIDSNYAATRAERFAPYREIFSVNRALRSTTGGISTKPCRSWTGRVPSGGEANRSVIVN